MQIGWTCWYSRVTKLLFPARFVRNSSPAVLSRGRAFFRNLGNIECGSWSDVPIPIQIQSWDLGAGESSVLAWARANLPPRRLSTIVWPDGAPRHLAFRRVGRLGLVLLAKTRGVIPVARPVVEELKRLGMYLSDTVIAEALSRVDE